MTVLADVNARDLKCCAEKGLESLAGRERLLLQQYRDHRWGTYYCIFDGSLLQC